MTRTGGGQHFKSIFFQLLDFSASSAAQVLLIFNSRLKKSFQPTFSPSFSLGGSRVVAFNRQLAVCPKLSSLFCSSSFFSRVTASRVKQVIRAVSRVTV